MRVSLELGEWLEEDAREAGKKYLFHRLIGETKLDDETHDVLVRELGYLTLLEMKLEYFDGKSNV